MGGDHDGRLTSRTIAALSGVSQTTVSRVLAGHSNVSTATRSKVLGVLAETGYTPNAAAQAMGRRRSGMLGVVVGRVTNPFFPELAEALHREITRRGLLMNLWISDGGEDDAGERAALDALRRRAIDGIVYTTATATSPSLREALGGAAPVVLLTHAGGVRGFEALAASPGGSPTAVFGINDVVAFGVIDGARRLGLTVPRDLSVAGYDDTEMAAWPGFGLTTVRQQTERMAELGVELLLARIAGDAGGAPQARRLEGELVIRSSTAAAPGSG